jgi:hypothetical protein
MLHLNRVFCHVVVFVIAIQLPGANLTASYVETPPENSLLAAAKSASDNDDLTGVQTIESKALQVDPDANRQGDRLVLRLSSGATRVYEDKPECRIADQEAKCQRYRLVAHARTRGVFVVAKLYSESAEYLLVDDGSGDEAVLRQFPIFSPSGKHVLVLLMNDEQLGFAVQVWRRDGARFVLDWSGSPHAEGGYTSYRLVRWLSEGTIELQSDASLEPPKTNLLKRFTLRHAAKGWNVVEVP